MTDEATATEPVQPTCPWCASPAAPDATRCTACGAAIAQRESIGDLRIPGLTSVDPALEDYDKRPLHVRGPSPSQGMAPALIVGALAGGPVGLVAIGGVAAVAGAELLGTRIGGPGGASRDDVGKPSEVALQALEHLGDEAAVLDAAAKPDERADAAADGGMSIWRDLPAVDPAGGDDGPG